MTIGVGLIGYGFAGKTFHAPLIGVVEGLDLRAVALRWPDRVAVDLPGVTVDADPATTIACDEVDLIVVATPNETHAPLARAAIAAGKHVVIDKPFALDLAEARSLIALAEERGVMLSVFHNRRWDSDFLTVRRAIDDGLVGEVSECESRFDRFRPAVRDRWRERPEAGSGIWFDLGPHLIDQALLLFGLPDLVQVDLARQRGGARATDWAHAVLTYGERRVILRAGMLVAGGTHRFTVHGEGGSLVKRAADPQEAQLIAGMLPGAMGWGVDNDPLLAFDGEGQTCSVAAELGDQRRYYTGLRAALAEGAPNPVRPIEALAVMAIVEAGVASSQARAAMPVPLTSRELAKWHGRD